MMNSSLEIGQKFKCDQCSEFFKRNFSLTLQKAVVHKALKKL